MRSLYIIFFYLLFSFISCSEDIKSDNDSIEIEQNALLENSNFGHSYPEKIIVYDKLNFGNGYNSVTGQEFFGVIEYQNIATNTEVVGGAKGNSGTVTMDILEDKESLKKSLNINAKVDLNLKIYGVTSNNTAKVDMYRETSFDSFSQNAILTAQYTNEPQVILNATVKDQWIDLAKRNPDEFMRTCGDMFVSKIYTGGTMYTLFSLQSRDQHQKETNETFIKSMNEYLGNQLNVEAKTSQLNESYSKVKNTKIKVITEGGDQLPSTNTLPDYIQYANEFKTQVSGDQRPILLYVELSPYESIAGFPKTVDFNKIRVVQKEFIESTTDFFDDVEESLQTAEFVIAHKKYFDDIDVEEADRVLEQFLPYITNARVLLNRCKSDFNDCDLALVDQMRDEFVPYDPDIDFPEFIGAEVPLSIDPNSGFETVFDDTGSGKILSIEGRLESRIQGKDKAFCQDVSLKGFRESYFNKQMKINKPWWRTDYVDVIEYYYRPYYEIRYTSVETGEILKTFPWKGAPLKTEPKVGVSIRLVNPNSKLQWRYDYANKSYQRNYVNIGNSLEKKLGFTRQPHFDRIKSCGTNEPPKVVISPIEQTENQPMKALGSSNSEEKKVVFVDKIATMDYD